MKLRKQKIAIGILLTTLVLNGPMSLLFSGVSAEIPSENDQTPLDPESAFTYANIGVWLIIAGDLGSHGGLEFIIKGCDQLYEILIGLGYDDSDIYYFAPEVEGYYQSPYAHAETDLDAINWAITEWAANKLSATQGIGIYMFDHGGIDVLALPGPNLTPTFLDDALDTLESKTSCGRSIIVYEACHSGSFVGDLSQEDRIIITSTDQIHYMYFMPSANWAVFSLAFWSSVAKCNSIGQAFEDAQKFVIYTGLEGYQWPWIDDNHDGVPHQTDGYGYLPNGGDGIDALNTVIGDFDSCPGGSIKITLQPWLYTHYLDFPYEISLVLPPEVKATDAYLKFVTPYYNPEDWINQEPEVEGEDEIYSFIENQLPMVHIGLNDGTHEIIMDADGIHGSLNFNISRMDPLFEIPMDEPGEYQICAYVFDDNGIMSNVVRSRVTFLEEGQEAPDDRIPPTVTIENPYNDTVIAGEIPIMVDANDNLALDRVQIYVDGIQVHDEMMVGPTYPLVQYKLNTTTYANGAHNITAIAYDHVGLQAQVTYTVEVKNEDTSDPTDDGNPNLFDDLDIPGYPLGVLFFISILGIISLLQKQNQRKQQHDM